MQDGYRSWHRYFMDFHRFSQASRRQVGMKNRQKHNPKKNGKNNGKQKASGGILEAS